MPHRTKLLILGAVLLSLFLAALDQTIVATALPAIVRDFNGIDLLSWVSTGYLLASTAMVPIYGKLSDMYGRKPILLWGIVVFLLGSAPGPASGRSARWHLAGWCALGLMGGLGFWSFPLIGVYLGPIGCLTAILFRRRLARLAVAGLLFSGGFAVGASPWLAYTATHGGITVLETGGQAIAGARALQIELAHVR